MNCTVHFLSISAYYYQFDLKYIKKKLRYAEHGLHFIVGLFFSSSFYWIHENERFRSQKNCFVESLYFRNFVRNMKNGNLAEVTYAIKKEIKLE